MIAFHLLRPDGPLLISLPLLAFLLFTAACRFQEKTTLVVTNARIWTANPEQPWAQALAVSGDRLAAVGSNAEIAALIGPSTRVIDARGKMVTPGFIDSHLHFLEGGFRLSSVQLRDARTQEEFVSRLEQFARSLEAGAWITGGDWNHQQWGGALPAKEWIDAVTPDNPVWVNRLDGHMALANSAALRAAGISRETPEVEGGTIVRDINSEPIGIFKDNAMSLVAGVIPDPTPRMLDRALEAAMEYVARQGVTSVHHMGTWDDLAVFERAHRENRLKTRIYAAVPLSTWQKLEQTVKRQGPGDSLLRIGALKGFVDGSLGSHTAAFFEAFSDDPENRGLLVNSAEDLYSWISNADRARLQVMVHAIGDRAVHILLNIFEQVTEENGNRDRRFRMEHVQHLATDDIPRFRPLQVIASMQPYHAIDDGRWAEKVIGPDRIRRTYAFRSLLDAGTRLALGSDWFVAPPAPLEGIYAAVTRRTLDEKHPQGWVKEQKISIEEALRGYTIEAAFASFEEAEKGSLEAGKLADFVVIDRVLTEIAPEEIRDSKILLTVMGGKVLFQSF